jgi:hypothetical protein
MKNKLLYRINYRGPAGKTFFGAWIEDKKAMNLQKNAMIMLHGENNVQVEVVDRASGRPVSNDEDDNE